MARARWIGGLASAFLLLGTHVWVRLERLGPSFVMRLPAAIDAASSVAPLERWAAEGLAERFALGLGSFRVGDFERARQLLSPIARSTSSDAPMAALYLARVARATRGCQRATSLYEHVRSIGRRSRGRHDSGRSPAAEAAYEEADCLLTMGDQEGARLLLTYGELADDSRARRLLEALGPPDARRHARR